MAETVTYKGFAIVIQQDTKKEAQPSNFDDISKIIEGIKSILTINDIYYLIKHDKDIQEDGTPKRTHYHLVLRLANKHSKKAILDQLAEALGQHTDSISIEPLLSEEKAIRYLIHKDNREKAQYNSFEILTNDRFYEKYIMGQELWLIEALKTSPTMADLTDKVGLDLANKYRGLAKDFIAEQDKATLRDYTELKHKISVIEWIIKRDLTETEMIQRIREVLTDK